MVLSAASKNSRKNSRKFLNWYLVKLQISFIPCHFKWPILIVDSGCLFLIESSSSPQSSKLIGSEFEFTGQNHLWKRYTWLNCPLIWFLNKNMFYYWNVGLFSHVYLHVYLFHKQTFHLIIGIIIVASKYYK